MLASVTHPPYAPGDTLDRARAMDAQDPLHPLLERFAAPDPTLIYFDGNSLGRPPRSTAERLVRVVAEEWAGELIAGWDHWMDLPTQVGDALARDVLGAADDEVIVADSTTVNLYRLAAAALDARPGRGSILMDAADFPTDRYVLEGLAASRGQTIRWLDGDPIEGPGHHAIEAVLDEDVALVVLSHVNYRSAAIADIAAIGARARAVGALTLWDLSHTAGIVPVDLAGIGADLAVGCTYKYLNAGPGAPAFQYVRRDLQDVLRTPIQGWLGRRDPFDMGPGWVSASGIRGWLSGTPSLLGLVAVDEGVRLVAEAGMDRIRTKSEALTAFTVDTVDAWSEDLGCRIGSPRDPARRGGHVSLRHPRARELRDALAAVGVVADFRQPDSLRIGLSPITTSFEDVAVGLDRLHGLLAGA